MPGKKVTLVPTEMAKKGRNFIFIDKSKTCEECSVKNACVENIADGRVYKITDLRSKKHRCKIAGEGRVVEVEEPPLKVVTAIHNEFVGSTKTFNPPSCNIDSCKYREFCINPPGVLKGEVLEITEITKRIKCKKGMRRFLIQGKRMKGR